MSDNKNNWRLAIIDEVYSPSWDRNIFGKKHTNVIAHVLLIDEVDYYEALIPEFNFHNIFIDKSRIVKFLWGADMDFDRSMTILIACPDY